MARTTEKELKSIVTIINNVTSNCLEPYRKVGDRLKANIGCYTLYMAYGSYGLEQICNESGGVRTIFELTSKKDLADKMRAYLKGLEVNN